MMKLSRMADYAVVLMTHMAADPGRNFTAQGLADRSHLPQPTVAKVMARLARGGLLRSLRGVKGGYGLAREPAAIVVADIVGLMDGPIALTDCLSGGAVICGVQHNCPSRAGVEKVNAILRDALSSVTLEDLAAPARLSAGPPPLAASAAQ